MPEHFDMRHKAPLLATKWRQPTAATWVSHAHQLTPIKVPDAEIQ